MTLPTPDWRFPEDLEIFCVEHRRESRYQRPEVSVPEVRDALFRYEAVRDLIKEEVPYEFALANALYWCAHWSLEEISEANHKSIKMNSYYVNRLKRFVLDPNYTPPPLNGRIRARRYPELLGLSVPEAAKALGMNMDTIYRYFNEPRRLRCASREKLDRIFVEQKPPLNLRIAANNKRLQQIYRAHTKRAKYFRCDFLYS